jgi:hypothetical protein
LLPILETYFRGERLEAWCFIVPLGVACIAFSGLMLREERSAFHWSIAVPFLVLGLVMLFVGGAVAIRTPQQVADLTALYQANPAAFASQEVARMQKVNAGWPVYLTTWVVFLCLGLLLRFVVARFLERGDWALGLGIALCFFGGVGLVIDGFAERRAHPYTAALRALAKHDP